MAAQFNGRNGTETLICDVIVVLNIATFLRQWVVRGVFDLNANLILIRKGPRSSPVVRRALFAGFSSLLCSIVSLLPQVSLQIVGTASFFNASRRGLKEIPNKLLTERVCSKLSSSKSSAQTRECFKGLKHSLFISFKFWILGELESANFGLWGVCAVNCYTKHFGFPLKFTVTDLKPKQFQISRISGAS